MKINAGIKSKEEAAQRILNGERFWFDGADIFFDETKQNPFRVGFQYLQDYWDYFSDWQIEARWEDNIGEGVLCWVWDYVPEHKSLAVVKEYVNGTAYPYKLTYGQPPYLNATPTTEEEVMKYVLKQE